MFAFGTFAQVTEELKSLTSALFIRLLKSTVKVELSERVKVAVPELESKVPDVSLAKFVSSRYKLISISFSVPSSSVYFSMFDSSARLVVVSEVR